MRTYRRPPTKTHPTAQQQLPLIAKQHHTGGVVAPAFKLSVHETYKKLA
jgi:hypothetical protein